MNPKESDKKNLSIENARDHLANERTFLAWIRTCLAIIGLGFVVVKFSLFVSEIQLMFRREGELKTPSYSLFVGIFLVAIGALIMILAYVRFRQTKKVLNVGEFKQSNWPLQLLVALMVMSGMLLIFYLVVST